MMLAVLLLFTAAVHAQVTGKVVDAATGRPLPEVVVVLRGTDTQQPESYIVETDGEGVFRVESVAPGRYEIGARREGYASPRRTPRTVVEPDRPAAALTVALVPLGAITGRLVDPDGDPIADSVVEALRYSWATGTRQLRPVGTARTNDRGEYRLFGLPPGRYRLRASQLYPPVGSSSRHMTIRGAKVDHVYPAVYFPGAPDAARAAELELAAGGELRGVNIQLRPQSLYTIRATATKTDASSEGRLLFGHRDLSQAESISSFALSGPGYGRPVRLPPVKPGSYLVWMEDRVLKLRAAQSVTVTDADVDVTLALTPGVTLAGAVQVEGGTRVALDAVRLRLEGDERWNVSQGSVQTDGQFAIGSLLPAAYRLRLTLPPGVYLKSMRHGDRVLETPRIDLSGTAAPLAVTLASNGGSVAGVVTNTRDMPAEGAAIVLAPSGKLQDWLDLQRATTAGGSGRFELRDIAPGEYLLFAWEDAEPGAPTDPEFRRPYEKQATAVRIEAGQQQTISLKAIPGEN